MGYRNRTYIDDMVDLFGYDYVIGYCLCSEHNLRNLAETEINQDKRDNMIRKANRFAADMNRLSKERFDHGL